METRAFGRSGEQLPILGLGCQRLVETCACPEALAVRIVDTAIDRGIRYFDTAWVYGLGQSEQRLGLVARTRRSEMWIATKTAERTRESALQQLGESLVRLQTDYVDEWRLHNIADLDDLDRCFQPGGVLEAATRARDQGLCRRISISCHTDPQVLIRALRRFPFDSALFPGSVLDRFVASYEAEFLDVAAAYGTATIAMKAFALGRLVPMHEMALRYTLGLPVSMVIVGCSKMEELEDDLRTVEHYLPLDEAERGELLRHCQPLVTPRNLPWKTPDWGKSGRWLAFPPSASEVIPPPAAEPLGRPPR